MHLTLITIGTRGDVQPCLALAIGLQVAGHHVRIATHAPYRDFVTRYGLDFFPLAGDPRAVLEGEVGVSWLETGRNPLTMLTRMRELALPLVLQLTQDCFDACQDTDAVLFSTLAFFPMLSVIEKLKLPAVGTYLQPINATRAFPAILFPPLPVLQSVYNTFTHAAMMEVTWQIFKDLLNQSRREVLDLPPLTTSFRHLMHRPFPIIYGFSPLVIPPPADWHEQVQVSGYWFLDDPRWQPPTDLLDFLDAGGPPIYIGFGSMSNRDPEGMTQLALSALEQSGQRGLLLTGWGGIQPADLPNTVFKIESAPHDWLFPRMAAVVHHGGAGTTAAGLRAGVPSILVPHFADQPFWGRRVADLGVGPQPIQRRQLTAERLAVAIRQAVTDSAMRQRAALLGAAIRAESGVSQAVRQVEQILESPLSVS